MKRIKIFLADDHDVVRSGLKQLLKSNPGFSVVGEARDGVEAVERVQALKPDILLVDISMPGMNGIEVTRLLKQSGTQTKIIVFTIHENEEYVYQLVRAGANGYVLKNAERNELFTAIKKVLEGEYFFSPSISRLLIQDYIKRSQTDTPVQQRGEVRLTKREVEILRLIAQGLTSTQIAQKLFLSVRTINTHRNNLMQKLNVHETASLVRYAVEHDILKTEE